MKAKLVKRSNGRFDLYSIEDKNQINTIASSFDNPIGKLSIKNCQAIECGYDLDELSHKEYSLHENNEELYGHSTELKLAYKAGVWDGLKRMLTILGDKKFSEDDVKKVIELSRETHQEGRPYLERDVYDYTLEQIIQSLQQTEWDVEIEMENYEPLYGMGSTPRPKLDADGCLILKTFKSE